MRKNPEKGSEKTLRLIGKPLEQVNTWLQSCVWNVTHYPRVNTLEWDLFIPYWNQPVLKLFSGAVFFQMSRMMLFCSTFRHMRGHLLQTWVDLWKAGECSCLLPNPVFHKCFSDMGSKVHSVLFSELSLSFADCMFNVDRNHPLARPMYDHKSPESCSLL